MNLRRTSLVITLSGLLMIAVLGVSPATAAVAPVITVSGSAAAVPAGRSVTISATVLGAEPTDVVLAATKSDDGWVEVGREFAGTTTAHDFVVTPTTLGPTVYRVGVLRGAALLAYSGPVRVIGVIAVNPDPVVLGQPVTLSGVLPTGVARPVGLQVRVDGDWTLVDADFSAADGSVSFVWTPAATSEVRFVAPARTIDGVEYKAQASTAVTVTVVDPPPPAA